MEQHNLSIDETTIEAIFSEKNAVDTIEGSTEFEPKEKFEEFIAPIDAWARQAYARNGFGDI